MKIKCRLQYGYAISLMAVFFSLATIVLPEVYAFAGEDTLTARSTIRSAAEIDYPPFSIVDEDGQPNGFSIELLRSALAAMRRDVTFQTGSWTEVRGWLEKGQVHALPLVGRTPERESIFDFTFPYMSIHGAIVVRKDTTDIQSLGDLKGREVAVMGGDNAEEFLRREDRGIKIHTTDSVQEALRELSEGQYDAVVIQRLVALRLIQETGLFNLQIVKRPIEGFRQDFCFAVKEGDRETLALLNEGLAMVMADGTFEHLHAKWFAALELPSNRRLVIGGDHNYPPFEYLDEKGRPSGYNVDLTRALAYELGLDIEIRLGPWKEIRRALAQGEIDALQGMFYSPERDLTFDFTAPHTINQCVSVVRKGESVPPTTLKELSGKRIVVQNGDIMHDFVLKNGLADMVSVVDAQEDALRELAQGKYDCALVSRLTALYWIKKYGWDNLTVGRQPFLSPEYCYAVPQNHQALLSELGEGLRILDENGEYRQIYEKWMGVYEDTPPGFLTIVKYVAMVALPLLVVILASFLWLRSLRKQVARRTAELLESETQYRLLTDNSLDVIWDMNLDLTFTYVNPACLDLTGYTPEEWIGTRLIDHCDEENYSKIGELIANGIAKGPKDSGTLFEAEILNKNREPIPVEIHAKVICDTSDQPIRVQGTARDISQRIQAEAALRYQDQLLREMGRLAKIGGWEFDPATGKGTWTEEVARIHDLDPDDETSMEQCLSYYRGDSRMEIENAVKAAIEFGKSYDLELEIITAKGVKKWVRTIGQPQLANGKVVQVRGSFQDITERKRTEQRILHLNRVLRAIRDVNQLIVHERDPDKLIREGCRLLVDNRGYSSTIIVLTDKNDRPVSWARSGLAASSEPLNTMLERGKLPPCCIRTDFVSEVSLVTERRGVCEKCSIADADGFAETQMLCARLAHEGVAFGYLIVALDHDLNVDNEEISLFTEMAGDLAYALNVLQMDQAHKKSERKRGLLEKQLIQAQKMESVGRLAGGVAHDFSNMLSVIIGYTELCIDQVEPEDSLYEDLETILKAAKRSTEITRQLLAFARRQTIAPKVLDLNRTVESMLKMLRRLIGEDIDLSWNPKAGLWPVKMDPSQIDQILANLCVNARDAIADVGKITIETDMVTFDESYCAGHMGFVPGEFVMLAVSDDGCGMDRETQDKIFEPFFTTKGAGKGTGLGLATVYGIVKQNEGFINVYSEPGKGSSFKIYLPKHAGLAVEARALNVEKTPEGHGEKVLVVEDEAMILNLAEKMLLRLGYNVLMAKTPAEALQLAEVHHGDLSLLVTDVVMPEMNGRELAQRLQTLSPKLKCLFMSGYTANVIAHRGILDEDVNFIQKPFSMKDLAIKVRGALDKE
ncbi:transporter substrate-binding domain-containing protein [uncultured Desulfosarcina sp.]|uniref:transporter substrate-binding domain-containing protein n=1 Tax=uncultured Desulfosarcina sp. TaxID=218289 RepID=UPI0029C96550|nr:transporter substrate-binding domain-containing protein [uncultured Desulfosarcina sp.]